MKRMPRILLTLLALVFFIIQTPANTKIRLDSFQQEFLFRINSVRQKGCKCGKKYMPPAQPLTWNEQLENSAYWHAKDMSQKRYFSHISRDGKRLMDRTLASGYSNTGYKSYMVGENIAQGQRSIKEVMTDWFRSESHCKNLMNPAFKEVGIAIVGNYCWVQDFGSREPFETLRKQTASK